MQQGYMAESPLGYVRSTAGAFDTAALISSLTFSGQTAAGIPAGTSLLIIQPEVQAVRLRDDGTAPTATIGYPLNTGAEFRYSAKGMQNLQAISQSAGAILNVWAFGAS